ncbi:hypothetical protein POM88_031074 [Heracleum sosnowskyi]|uniref:Uncharacterized protein n=1 Tax=Heracleum sosnowskyi TaxID=360622 RepID=A0AAD8MIT0_9APIA|nr:hypothetical protein POM88_031074 [Heracleum sosnowskyi]
MDEDPYESITKECQITISQQQKLRICRFAFEPDSPCPVQVTGITMVSPPESGSEYVEEDIFHTPPEHHQSRSVSSSDDPGPEIRPGSHQVVQKSCGDVEGVVCDHDASEVEVDLKGKKVDSQFTSRNDCLGDTEPVVIESEDSEIAETEVVDLSVDENCDKLGERVSKETENVVEVAECETSRGRLGRKNVEDLDAFKYVSNGGVGTQGGRKGVCARRQLPNSFKEPEENEGLWVPRRSLRDTETFKGLVAAAGARIVSGENSDTDYMKVAKERGCLRDRSLLEGVSS